MDEQTPRLSLPFLDPGQAQKEITHNEALMLLDLAVQASVEAVGTNDPPAAPAVGAAWIVGDTPTGPWNGMAGRIAGWSSDGWRFVAPFEGMRAWSRGDGGEARFAGGQWRVAERPAIPAPAGGATIDTEARASITAVLAALANHDFVVS